MGTAWFIIRQVQQDGGVIVRQKGGVCGLIHYTVQYEGTT